MTASRGQDDLQRPGEPLGATLAAQLPGPLRIEAAQPGLQLVDRTVREVTTEAGSVFRFADGFGPQRSAVA